jgi:hypothetical protein
MDAPLHNTASDRPACPGCAERDRRIAQLEARIAEQDARLSRLEALARGAKRQFNVAIGHCCGCKRRVQGRHPLQSSDALGAAASQLGPDAQALAVLLNKESGLSHGKIQRFFKAAFGLGMGRASPCRVMLRAARKCEGTCQAIVRRVQRSDAMIASAAASRR